MVNADAIHKNPERMLMRCAAVLLALGFGPCSLKADQITLQNGQTVDGTLVGGDSRAVRFASGDQVHTYTVGETKPLTWVTRQRNRTGPPTGFAA